ncbi:RDD family protein [Flavobacterium humi]|uniref:RDD family protein n=1 Tax=Flavobacterium humi TaxID=2562683 RepID=A0A4Z0L8N9_9FLAO|nr:RDD family protein [Flavobacterium humi]TGD58154.1 RDD family protein [Flavobacterium humi]
MSELSINTTQNVNINFTAATVGERILASFLDFLIKTAYGIVVFYIFFYWMGLTDKMAQMDYWSNMAIIILFYFPVLIYSITLESIFEGQTFGKKLVKIKVVKIDGYQAGFGDYLIRWIFRAIEKNSIFIVVGLVAMGSNKRTQRIGDIAAGTAVITLKNSITINHTILEELGSEYIPTYPSVIKLSDNDVRIIKDTFEIARTNGDFEIISKLRAKIEEVTGIKNQSKLESDFIRIIIKDYNFYTKDM